MLWRTTGALVLAVLGLAAAAVAAEPAAVADAAEHHDRVAVDRRLDGVAVARLQRLREIDAGDLGEEARRAWRNRDAQRSLLRL